MESVSMWTELRSAYLYYLSMSFGLYSVGFAIVICGLSYAAYLLHIPAHWILVGAAVLLGIGILSGVKATRQKDPVS